MKIRSGAPFGAAGAFVLALTVAPPADAALVNAFFPSTIACPPICGDKVVSLNDDAQVRVAVEAAASQISSNFGGAVTTNILFYGIHAGTNPFPPLATSAAVAPYTYAQYTAALAADAAAHPENTALNSAVAHLETGNGANDPNAYVAPTTVAARALGLGVGAQTAFGAFDSSPEFSATGDYVGQGGFADGIVYINLDTPLTYSRPLPPTSSGFFYDAQTLIERQIDEVLGIGGNGSELSAFRVDPNYAQDFFGLSGEVYGPLDLDRYASSGAASFDPVSNALGGGGGTVCGAFTCIGTGPSAYFSVDGGVTSIAPFNQGLFLDQNAGDWAVNLKGSCPGGVGKGGVGDVQDLLVCNNESFDVTPGTPSYQALEAIGYNPAGALPEPQTWLLLLSGAAAIGTALRRRRPGGFALS